MQLACLRRERPARLFVAGVAAVAASTAWLVAPLGGSDAGAAATNHIGYSASVYGSRASGSAAVAGAGSGKSAWTVIGCTTQPGLHPQDSTAGVTLPHGLGTIDAIANSASTAFAAGTRTASVQGTSTTGAVSLLGGIISAQAVQSTTSASGQENGTSPHGTASATFVNLSIAGHSEGGSPPPNTKIPLPGIGQVVLNSQHVGAKPGYLVSATAEAMLVKITVPHNPTGLPAGAQVVVAHSFVGLSGPVAGTLGKEAYGTELVKSSVVKSGPTFPEFLGCFGTGGKTVSNDGANVNALLLQAAGIHDTAMGVDHKGQPLQAQLSSTVTTATLGTGGVPGVPSVPGLPGTLLKVDTVKAVANSTTAEGKTTLSENGSEILGLEVGGTTVPANTLPPANTSISVPQVGTLWLNRVIPSQGGTTETVRMIELQIDNAQLAAAVGTPDLRIAVAKAHS